MLMSRQPMGSIGPPRPQLREAEISDLPATHDTYLDTGLRTTYIDLPGRNVAAIQLVFAGGAAHDPPRLLGLSRVLADTVILASAARGREEFALAVESAGATFTAGCDHDCAYINVTAPGTRLIPALELLAEAVIRPTFDTDLIRWAVDRRAVEIRQAATDPYARAANIFAAAAYPACGFGRPSGGTEESITRLEPRDVRRFYDRRIGPAHAHLIVAGDLAATRLRKEVEHTFGAWRKPSEAPPRVTPSPARAGRCLIADIPGAGQSALILGRAGPALSIGPRIGMEIAVHALGGWFGSRISRVLREERGHAYGVQSWLVSRPAARSRHHCQIQFRTATANPDIGRAVQGLIDEVGVAAERGLPATDLCAAADHLIRVQGVRWEAARHLTEAYAHLIRKGYAPGFLQRRTAAIAAVRRRIRPLDLRYLRPDRLTLVAAGDSEILRPALTDIGLAPEVVEESPA